MPYFTEPPLANDYIQSHGDIPRFMRKYYTARFSRPKIDLDYILRLIAWAEKEFEDVRAYLVITRDRRRIKLFRKATVLSFLASTKEFDTIVKNMDSQVWKTLPLTLRETLINTKKIYDSLGV